jgi:hypothetical protein
MLRRFLVNYLMRHRNRFNQLLHLVGVPLTFIVSTALLFRGQFPEALFCFVAGYVLQFVGHAIEGNDAGEAVLLKKWLGRPFVEFAAKSDQSKSDDP